MLLPFSYAIVSGVVGSCSVLFAKSLLNEGLSLFDAILIVPMFQIAWTFFSICTGFVYFQEYQVFGALRTTMFILGMISVFIGISLLAPDEAKGKALVSPIERYAVVPDDNVKRINFAEGKI
ncbi:hypothetical protein CsSME_00028251 [Camellia sinensis var. sinensis]